MQENLYSLIKEMTFKKMASKQMLLI